jgi:hypothetical protein
MTTSDIGAVGRGVTCGAGVGAGRAGVGDAFGWATGGRRLVCAIDVDEKISSAIRGKKIVVGSFIRKVLEHKHTFGAACEKQRQEWLVSINSGDSFAELGASLAYSSAGE